MLQEKDFLGQSYITLLLSGVQYCYKNLEEEIGAVAVCFLFTIIENADASTEQLDGLLVILSHMSLECMQLTTNQELQGLALQVLSMLYIYDAPKMLVRLQSYNLKLEDLYLEKVVRLQQQFRNEEESLRVMLSFVALLPQWNQLPATAR